MSNRDKRDSPLVRSVLALDNYLSELERVGTKITSTDLTSDFDTEYMQKLMAHFAECGQGVAEEVTNLSKQLQEARARAEVVAAGVSRQAEVLESRRKDQSGKLQEFRILGEKVQQLTAAIAQFRLPQGQGMTQEDREKLASNIPAFEAQLSSLIEDLQTLRESARNSQMKALARNAESLGQTLQAVRLKLRELRP